jgi:catalytic LigB subunit of aromatic ring-opening dioxygenase
MGDILCIGVSHYPPLSGKNESMANIFRNRLNDPGVPDAAKDPANWPQMLRDELGEDDGAAAAEFHRQRMTEGMSKCMQALRDFNPDFCVIWGDDQYENFREDIIPPFSVLAYEDMVLKPWAQSVESSDMVGKPNYWDEPKEFELPVKFAQDEARQLVSDLIHDEFDMAYAYKPLHHPGIAHSILNAILYLDWERKGWDWPIIPVTVNCYGERVISHRGFVTDLKDERRPDPPAPVPKRCYDLGAATARIFRDSPHRVALIASSSWSHAFLCDKTFRLLPDVAFDREMYSALLEGDYEHWRNTSLTELTDTGNPEMLNWMALAGAMNELGRKPVWSDFVETCLFNSTKVALIG